MKALTGLPTSAYLKVSEQANIHLSDLLALVQELEAGASAAYLAHYRPDIAGRLNEDQLRAVETQLRHFLDLEDRRITILTAIGQQNRLTPELREQIESAMDRWELEDLYFPYKPKRKTAADEANEKGLEPLARFLWDQEPANADIAAVAQAYVDPTRGVLSVSEALRWARHIVARWLGEDAGIRRDLRKIVYDESQIVVLPGQVSGREEGAKRRYKALVGYRARVRKAPWRQMLAIRRAEREGGVRCEIVLPENKAVAYLLGRLLQDRRSLFCLQLGAAAYESFSSYLAPVFRHELTQALNERCDAQAIQVFQDNLRKLLLTPPAGRMTVIGLETGRPGGWRAAVVDAEGQFVEGAIVYPPEQEEKNPSEAQESSPNPLREKTRDPSEQSAPPNAESETAEVGPAEEENAPKEEVAQTGPSETSSGQAQAQHQRPSEQGTPADAEAPPSPEPDHSSKADSVEATQPDSRPVGEATPQPALDRESAPEGEKEGAESEAAPPPAAQEGRPDSTAGSAQKLPPPPYAPLSQLLTKHNVAAVVVPNGPGVRQVERLIRSAIREAGTPKVFWTTINEAGSWIYATSKTARREMRDLEPALRSAVCLAHRLQDPLPELVRVDPKVLGVGQHHHDVDARRLRAGLRAAMESAVHNVGVDLNSATVELLSLVPGLTERLAKRVVEHRKKLGKFARRGQLRGVPGLSDRIYKQAAGFVRVRGGDDPLDDTAIHPEMYPIIEKILAAAGVSASEALEKPEVLEALQLEQFQGEAYPVEVLRAMVKQFHPCARNPRGAFVAPQMPVELLAADQLKVGMKVEGVVTNIASFGAFVDIGADQDGLVHISRLSEEFVKDSKAAVKVGDRILVHILALEEGGRRISLSTKPPRPAPAARRGRLAEPRRQKADSRKSNGARRRRKEPDREGAAKTRSFGPDEKAKAREAENTKKLSLDEKLALLQTKYRTKVK